MSSNYNYNNFSLAQLNSLTPVTAPEMSDEDLNRELELWSNTQFTFEGMGLLDEEFQVSPTIDTKLEEQDVNVVTQPAMIVQHDLTTLTDQTQTQQTLHYPLFTFPTANSLVPTRLQPITIAPVSTSSNTDDFTPIFPAVSVPTNVANNSIILSKETQENAPNTISSTTKITTDSTSTFATKTTTAKTINATNTATSSTSTGGPVLSPNRKNSSSKSNQPSNSETTQTAETKEGEKDPELAAKLAAEEDKRRRNTAASARFRVKKKMREQALERTAREMTAKAETFEGRVRELEMEIKWLRSLIVEKDARLLDVERPGKKRKKDESEEENEDDEDDEKEKEMKQEQSDQTNQKGVK